MPNLGIDDLVTTRAAIERRLRLHAEDTRTRGVFVKTSRSESNTLPLQVSLSGYHEELGYIKSEGYFTPEILSEIFETWRKQGVKHLNLEYTEGQHVLVFGT
jgi:hypothetical protein